MSKRLPALLLLLSCTLPLHGQDAGRMAQVDSLLAQYVTAIRYESIPFKEGECDFILSSCSDPLVRQRAAVSLYDHYLHSDLMGEEAVAIYLFDNWFSTSRVHFPNRADSLNAAVFAEFNRSSLLGCKAPGLKMRSPSGSSVTIPRPGRRSILYFYDTSCSKCNLTGILLRYLLEEDPYDVDLYAVYVGDNAAAWESYRQEKLDIEAPSVNVFHLWDPELDSDFQRLWGVLQTPGLFLVDTDGTIIGRRLDVEALKRLLIASDVERSLDSLCPVGERLPRMKIDGRNIRRYDYLVFYAEGCSRCSRELSAMEERLPRRTRVLKVDVDRVLDTDPELAGEIFSHFDVSVLPFILKEDKKGRVIEKYVTFVDR